MNYFFLLWYSLLSSFAYFVYCLYSNVTVKISEFVDMNHVFERVWIFPFYLFSELAYFMLNRYGEYIESFHYMTEEEKKDSLNNTAVIIPCHHALEEIKKNRENLQNKFKYIFIADNNNKNEVDYDLQAFCEENNLIYRYYNIPCKTNAILQTAYYIKDNFPFLDKIVLLDDDTVLGKDFFIRTDLLSESTCAGYTCTIGIQKSEKSNMIEEWIDFEYRTISYRNRSRNFHTLKFLHGIICVYKLSSLLRIYEWNTCNVGGLPFGEDAFSGIQARNCGYKLKQDHQNIVYTFCPTKIFNFERRNTRVQGYGASSLFKQRVMRWYLSWPRRLLNEFGLLFFFDTGSWLGNVLYRFDFLWYLWILSVSSWWIGILVEMSLSVSNLKHFMILHAIFYGMNIFTSSIRRCIMSEKERETIKWYTPITFPLFLLLLMFFYSCSFLLSVFYYIPFYRLDYKKCYQHVQ